MVFLHSNGNHNKDNPIHSFLIFKSGLFFWRTLINTSAKGQKLAILVSRSPNLPMLLEGEFSVYWMIFVLFLALISLFNSHYT